jgi:hypothetical protein
VSYRQNDSRIVPVTISLVIAVVCAIILTVMIHDRWTHLEIKSANQTEHATTGSAANKAGAKVMQTDPKLSVGPKPSGPEPIQPANPN